MMLPTVAMLATAVQLIGSGASCASRQCAAALQDEVGMLQSEVHVNQLEVQEAPCKEFGQCTDTNVSNSSIEVFNSSSGNATVDPESAIERMPHHKDLIAAIIKQHNDLRAGVSAPCTAADMETLTWDHGLAKAARSWAEKCEWQHDPTNHANGWGENLGMRWSSGGTTDIAHAISSSIQAWYDEIVDAEWLPDGSGVRSKIYSNPREQCKNFDGTDCIIGHFTQVVWAKTNKVGCEWVTCPSGTLGGHGGFFLVCKYSPAGNMRTSSGDLTMPWTVGASCAACIDSCSQGKLCDVGSSPNHCKDKSFTFTFSGTPYTDCASLTREVTSFCDTFNPEFHFCDLTCAVCKQPANLGMDTCGSK